MALPLGVEPRSSVPETNVLSIELQELNCSSTDAYDTICEPLKAT